MSYYVNIEREKKRRITLNFSCFLLLQFCFFPTGSFSSRALPYMPFSTNKAILKAHSGNNILNLNTKYLSITAVHRFLN